MRANTPSNILDFLIEMNITTWACWGKATFAGLPLQGSAHGLPSPHTPLHAFGPPPNEPAERDLRSLLARDRAVERGPVGHPPAAVDLHAAG
jgi:hypothetical protein